jgi:hypothetical protein
MNHKGHEGHEGVPVDAQRSFFTVMARLVRATHDHLIHPVCMAPPHFAPLQRGMTGEVGGTVLSGLFVPFVSFLFFVVK